MPLPIIAATALKWTGARLLHFLIYAILGALLLWAVWVTVIKPHVTKPQPTNTQQGQRDNYNYKVEIKPTFGCAYWKAYKIPEKTINETLNNNITVNP